MIKMVSKTTISTDIPQARELLAHCRDVLGSSTLNFSVSGNGRYLVRNHDVLFNVSVALMHMAGNSMVKVTTGKRGKLTFVMSKGFVAHHINRCKTNDSMANIVVLPKSTHNRADWLGDKDCHAKEYHDYLNSVKVC